MGNLEKAIREANSDARAIGEILLEVGKMSPQAAKLIEEDLENPEMGLDKCFQALREFARSNQNKGCWSCCVFGIDPENEAVAVILDFYKIPPEWLTDAAPKEEPDEIPVYAQGGGKIDLLDLL